MTPPTPAGMMAREAVIGGSGDRSDHRRFKFAGCTTRPLALDAPAPSNLDPWPAPLHDADRGPQINPTLLAEDGDRGWPVAVLRPSAAIDAVALDDNA